MRPSLRRLAARCSALGVALGVGYAVGREDTEIRRRVLPTGKNSCCDGAQHDHQNASQQRPSSSVGTALCDELSAIVGREHVLTDSAQHSIYTRGARIGSGRTHAVVRPGTLREAVAALRACVAAGFVVLPQGANTGLTGGSVPRDGACDRPYVVMSTRRLTRVVPIEGGRRVLCFAGAGIFDLAQTLSRDGETPRESHSVLGSMFLNPSVGAGVAFGSGGTQLRKGPAYTERVLWCRVTKSEQSGALGVELINSTGVVAESDALLLALLDGGDDEAVRAALDDSAAFKSQSLLASDATRYSQSVCTLDHHVSRCNADLRGPPPNRSEGKVLILATVHDTFEAPRESELMWIGCDSLATAQALKRDVFLRDPETLPRSCEYIDRATFDVINTAGRGLCTALRVVGIGAALRAMWDIKTRIESSKWIPFAPVLCDNFLYFVSKRILPAPLPHEIMSIGARHDHHILVDVGDWGGGELAAVKARLAKHVDTLPGSARIEVHRCTTPAERSKVTYFRFAAAPAFRTYCVGKGLQGISVDYALPKQEKTAPTFDFDAVDDAEGSSSIGIAPIVTRMRYSHFGCNVVHEDLALGKGDAHALKMRVKAAVEAVGGKLPAEHGHGVEYAAPPATQARWRAMDPSNSLNPGVGGLSYARDYGK